MFGLKCLQRTVYIAHQPQTQGKLINQLFLKLDWSTIIFMSPVWTVEMIHDIQYTAHLSLKGRCHSAVAVHLSALNREYKTPRCK